MKKRVAREFNSDHKEMNNHKFINYFVKKKKQFLNTKLPQKQLTWKTELSHKNSKCYQAD